jgi:hypothetical protein
VAVRGIEDRVARCLIIAMAHLVIRKGKYASLEESYRDESGRPRKRVLAYYGRSKPPSILDIDWHASIIGEPQGGSAAVTAEFTPQGSVEAVQDDKLPTGLHTGPTDPTQTNDETHPTPSPPDVSAPDDGPQSESDQGQDAGPSSSDGAAP